MSNFKYMSNCEIVQHVEVFGTDNERELIKRFYERPDDIDWSVCPICEKHKIAQDEAAARILDAQQHLNDAIDAL